MVELLAILFPILVVDVANPTLFAMLVAAGAKLKHLAAIVFIGLAAAPAIPKRFGRGYPENSRRGLRHTGCS